MNNEIYKIRMLSQPSTTDHYWTHAAPSYRSTNLWHRIFQRGCFINGILLLVPILLTSCANPYARFYNGIPNARVLPWYESVSGAVEIYNTDNVKRDELALRRRGYNLIGESSFSAGASAVSENQVRKQAEKIGAQIVLVSSRYLGSVSGAMPLTVPQTSTAYSYGSATAYGAGGPVTAYGSGTTTTYGSQTVMMPYSFALSDYSALYFAKGKARLGIYPVSIDDATRRKLKTNFGVLVELVVENTTAYEADVLPGDVILAIGEDNVKSVENYYSLLDKYEGKIPRIKISRDGINLEKNVEIRSFK